MYTNYSILIDIVTEADISQLESLEYNPGSADEVHFGDDISAYPDTETYSTVQTVAVPSIAVRMPRF